MTPILQSQQKNQPLALLLGQGLLLEQGQQLVLVLLVNLWRQLGIHRDHQRCSQPFAQHY
jgi:hypothetical protein